MVFWITYQQIKYFDFFRPGDMKNFENISSSHTYKENITFENISSKKLFEILELKMENPKFRFMRIICQEKGSKIFDNYAASDVSNKIGKNELNKYEEQKSYYIKLYKLTDIFQFLSVIEINIDLEMSRNNNEEKKEEIVKEKVSLKIRKDHEKFGMKNRKNGKMKNLEKNENHENGKMKIKMGMKSVSVSIFPSFVLFGFFFGFLFFFLPFPDFGCNEKYIQELKLFFEIIGNNSNDNNNDKNNDDKNNNSNNDNHHNNHDNHNHNYDNYDDSNDTDSNNDITTDDNNKQNGNENEEKTDKYSSTAKSVNNNKSPENNGFEIFTESQEYFFSPSKIFFLFFILFPVLLVSYFLLSFQ